MISVDALSDRNHLAIPAVPPPGLVTADEHHDSSVGIECEEHPDAVMQTQLLEIVDARALDRIHPWSP
jgi:hypothetical protein